MPAPREKRRHRANGAVDPYRIKSTLHAASRPPVRNRDSQGFLHFPRLGRKRSDGRRGHPAPQHCVRSGRRSRLGRSRLLQPRFRRAHSLRQSFRRTGRAFHRHAFALRGLHAHSLRDSLGALLLADPSETGSAAGILAQPHRTRPPHRSRDAQAARLLHRRRGQVAPGLGRPRKDRLHPAVASRSSRLRLRLLFRHPELARLRALPVFRKRSPRRCAWAG